MSEPSSTLSFPLKWASKEYRKDEPLETRFFLFHNGEGCVVVREPAENRDKDHEARIPGTGSSASTVGVENNSAPLTMSGVPRTRVLRRQSEQRYILLKKYEGYLTARDEDSFSARLFENDSDYPVLDAVFDLEELSETDRELAVEGAPMVWTIGYAYEGSTRKRESSIYLRRLPAWDSEELERGRKAAKDLTSAIRWE